MSLTREQIEDLIFGKSGDKRFTQDSPILPDVWIAYGDPARGLNAPLDLLLTPHRGSDPVELCNELTRRLAAERKTAHWKKRHKGEAASYDLTYNESCVVVRLHFDELIRAALPLTGWWRENILRQERSPQNSDYNWLREIVGSIELSRGKGKGRPSAAAIAAAFQLLAGDALKEAQPAKKAVLWSVSLNRGVQTNIWRSVNATKADAATRLFNLNCSHLCWAVIDSGVDASHPAFRKRQPGIGDDRPPYPAPFQNQEPFNATRVVATYDFTRLRKFLAMNVDDAGQANAAGGEAPAQPRSRATKPEHEADFKKIVGSLGGDEQALVQEMRTGLRSGRSIDWRALEPLLRVPHKLAPAGATGYIAPQSEHGTHVAGILAADWRAKDLEPAPDGQALRGVCPDLQIYDLRVIDDRGMGSEFSVLAALQFIRWLNANKDEPVIHGVNLSLSLLHDVANFACGRTPVCDECERLVGAGTIVVAAAGNEGYAQFTTPRGQRDGYRSISITDPGNAESVITVGSTHRFKPHTYGVSYFSSRGPTGDGRLKPDLVAPGEKIKSAIPGGKAKTLDGTSMAAPHVSGAAALLLARHGELMGQPARVKQILCKSATDLGRERFFQGAGMVDVLRALQSI